MQYNPLLHEFKKIQHELKCLAQSPGNFSAQLTWKVWAIGTLTTLGLLKSPFGPMDVPNLGYRVPLHLCTVTLFTLPIIN